MATLTIRNLPEEVHDALRREAAEHRQSMEEEARQALTARFRKRLSPEELVKRLDEIKARHPARTAAKMLASEFLIASRRLESLFESELISRDEKISWDDKISRDAVSLSEVEQFAAGKRNWPTEKS
jgi:plasmid stability protein